MSVSGEQVPFYALLWCVCVFSGSVFVFLHVNYFLFVKIQENTVDDYVKRKYAHARAEDV